ncbi:MAG TPA: hypothetical protein VJC20_01420 [Candidatus Paceibacterota bacterium]
MCTLPAVVDITPQNAVLMCDVVRQNGGSTFSVFLHASREERRGRIGCRQPDIPETEIDRMLDHDPVDPNPALYPDFLIVPNPDGQLDETAAVVIVAVRQFLAEKSS